MNERQILQNFDEKLDVPIKKSNLFLEIDLELKFP